MQFSLRVFLGSITLLAVAMALMTVRAEAQRKAVRQLKDRGVTVVFDGTSMPLDCENSGSIHWSDSHVWNCWHTATSVWFSRTDYDCELETELR
ncbi:MAG: hypothetical protein AAF870_03555, partial [Pseudomonadota bacterium]